MLNQNCVSSFAHVVYLLRGLWHGACACVDVWEHLATPVLHKYELARYSRVVTKGAGRVTAKRM